MKKLINFNFNFNFNKLIILICQNNYYNQWTSFLISICSLFYSYLCKISNDMFLHLKVTFTRCKLKICLWSWRYVSNCKESSSLKKKLWRSHWIIHCINQCGRNGHVSTWLGTWSCYFSKKYLDEFKAKQYLLRLAIRNY